MFMMDKMDPAKTTMKWTTEWVSNLHPEIAAAFLQKKKDFMSYFSDANFHEVLFSKNRLNPAPLPCPEVQEMMKILDNKYFTCPQGGEHLKLYVRHHKTGKMFSEKLQQSGIPNILIDYFGGSSIIIPAPFVASQKADLNGFAMRLHETYKSVEMM
mmetsp:Transcript_22360/g.16842  ORF Transcript_22360/g.16842 Transcript_22360/m.16842 type:complete len:156 (+) Transcript_22360:1910-2377(+)